LERFYLFFITAECKILSFLVHIIDLRQALDL